MAKLEKSRLKNQMIHMVGRLWVFPEVTYTKDLEGEMGISLDEMQNLQYTVANHICGEASALTGQEFDFLSELTATTAKEMTEILGCSHTNFSKWRKKGSVPFLESIVLKEVFWTKLFADRVGYPKAMFGKDRLKLMANAAISSKVVRAVTKKAA